MWPPCQMIVAIDGDYDAFEAEAGVQCKPYAGGTATMQVQVDGKTRFDSGTITENDAAETGQGLACRRQGIAVDLRRYRVDRTGRTRGCGGRPLRRNQTRLPWTWLRSHEW